MQPSWNVTNLTMDTEEETKGSGSLAATASAQGSDTGEDMSIELVPEPAEDEPELAILGSETSDVDAAGSDGDDLVDAEAAASDEPAETLEGIPAVDELDGSDDDSEDLIDPFPELSNEDLEALLDKRK